MRDFTTKRRSGQAGVATPCDVYYVTRCSAIVERPRCRGGGRYSFGEKWKTGTGR